MPVRKRGKRAKDTNGNDLAGIWHDTGNGGFVAEVSIADQKTGKRRRVVQRFETIKEARIWRQDEKELQKNLNRQGNKINFEALTEEYLDWSKVNKKASSFTRDTHTVKHLKEAFGKKLINDITRRDVEKYVTKRRGAQIGKADKRRTIKPATVNRELCCLKNMLRKAVDWEYLDSNPAWGVKQTKEHPPESEFLTRSEIEKLVEACPPQIKTFVILALNTGLRKGELFNLKWKDIDFNKGAQGIIAVSQTKNHETRYIPINQTARLALEAHPKRIINGQRCELVLCNEEGRPYKNIRKSFKSACLRAGITKHLRIHDLRHTFASQLVMQGVDLRTVAKLLGHRDIKMTLRYAHLEPEHLESAVNVLDTPTSNFRERQQGAK